MQWIRLAAVNLCFVVMALIPFIPGPATKISIALSVFAQSAGFFGLLLIPVGIVWLIREIRKVRLERKPDNNWTNGFYFAVIALVFGICVCLVLAGLAAMIEGWRGVVFSGIVITLLLWILLPQVKKLRHTNQISFNAAPLYLMTVPLIALLVRLYLMAPVSDYSRGYAIAKSQEVIAAIENYKEKEGHYPETLEDLKTGYLASIPLPSVMGINKFRYEITQDSYMLSFVQWQHLAATEEVVAYNKNDMHIVKGHFESFDSKEKHWRYYWLD